jgi:hypothetical protein
VVFVRSYPARAGGIATFSGEFRAAHDVTVGAPSRAIAIDEPGGFARGHGSPSRMTTPPAIEALHDAAIRIAMLTGDHNTAAIMVAEVRAHRRTWTTMRAAMPSPSRPLAFVAGARCPLLPGVFLQPVVYNGPALPGTNVIRSRE